MLTLFDDSIFDTSIVHSKENKPENQEQLDNNEAHFNKQCKKVFDLLMGEEVLSSKVGVVKFNMMDVKRRIKDLRDIGVRISDAPIAHGHGAKAWFMTYEDMEYNKKFL
jgi:hypothetical protein